MIDDDNDFEPYDPEEAKLKAYQVALDRRFNEAMDYINNMETQLMLLKSGLKNMQMFTRRAFIAYPVPDPNEQVRILNEEDWQKSVNVQHKIDDAVKANRTEESVDNIQRLVRHWYESSLNRIESGYRISSVIEQYQAYVDRLREAVLVRYSQPSWHSIVQTALAPYPRPELHINWFGTKDPIDWRKQ